MFNIPTLLLVICTAYTPAFDECGKTDGITASGHPAIQGVTVACDGLPLGTEVVIDGHSYIVQDRFGGDYGKTKIDIFMNTKAEAFRFGRQTKIVEVKPYVETKATFCAKDWSEGLYQTSELLRRAYLF
jgi:3D (Asp-Asp-Asp) domain-containing protein